MSSVMSLTTLLGTIAVPGLALALITASARRYLRSIERQLAHAGGRRHGRMSQQR
jgi:hypothetical protein